MPFYKTLKRFGLAEAMKGQEEDNPDKEGPQHPSEWQFQMLKSVKYHLEEQGHIKQAKTEGKMDVAEWMKLKSMLGGTEEDGAEQALADVTGKTQSSKHGKQWLALQDKPSCSEDGEGESSCALQGQEEQEGGAARCKGINGR